MGTVVFLGLAIVAVLMIYHFLNKEMAKIDKETQEYLGEAADNESYFI